MNSKGTVGKLLATLLATALLNACSDSDITAKAATAPAPQPPSVDVSQVITDTITDWDYHTGRLQAPETVVLIPRVSGYIQQVNFKEGTLVQAGEVLFQIDPRPFKAEVERLKAELRSAQSGLTLAGKDFARAEKLKHQKLLSEENYDSRYSAKQQALAKVMAVQAELHRAELDLEFTQVKAPISGRLSYAEVTAGNYVTAGQTELTKLVSTDRMYAYFDVDEATFLNYQKVLYQGEQAAVKPIVYLGLANEEGYGQTGNIDFIDNRVNEKTGTIRLRASFANKDGHLVPGLFSRIKMAASPPHQAVLVNEKAVGTDLNNKYVLVVDKDNKVAYRPVKLGEKNHGLQVIAAGLQPNETIVVNGLQRVFPNMTIAPNVVNMIPPKQLAQFQHELNKERADQTLSPKTRSLAKND